MLKLYYFLQSRIQTTELKLSQKIRKKIDEPYSSSVFYFSVIVLNIVLVFWQVSADLLKFAIILTRDPGVSFNIFFKQKELRSCPFSYHYFKNLTQKIRIFSFAGIASMVIVAVITSLLTNFLFGGKNPTSAQTFGWIQSSWSGGANASVALHTDASARTGWNKYFSADATVLAGSAINLTLNTATTTQTTDVDFNASTTSSSITTANTGTSSALQLSLDSRDIGSGNNFYCYAKQGNVYCWGSNGCSNNQLGQGVLNCATVSYPTAVGGPSPLQNVKQLDVTMSNSCALKNDGTVWCWGHNGYGQLGNNSTTEPPYPVQVLGGEQGGQYLTNVIKISLGAFYSCALTSDGSVYCWGDNLWGQLGNGNKPNDSLVPVKVKGIGGSGYLSGMTDIEAGGGTVCALNGTGYSYCWGDNAYKQLFNGTTNSSLYPVQSIYNDISDLAFGDYDFYAYIAYAVVRSGTIYHANRNQSFDYTKPIASESGSGTFSGFSQLTIEDGDPGTLCAIKNGSVYCWGNSPQNASTTNTTYPRLVPNMDQTAYISPSSYTSVTMAVKNDGNVYTWGLDNTYNSVTPIPVYYSAGVQLNLNHYAASGSYTSGSIYMGNKVTSLVPTFSTTLLTGTSIGLDIYGKVNSGDAYTLLASNVSSGSSVSGAAGKKYFRYVATLNANGAGTLSPSLNDVSLKQTYYGNRGPIALHHLDGTGSIVNGAASVDSSGYGNNGVFSCGSSNSYTTGKIGQGFTNLSGNNLQFNMTNSPLLDKFTLEGWFNTATSGTMVAVRSGAAAGSGMGTCSYGNSYCPTPGSFVANIVDGAVLKATVYTTQTYTDSNWHHGVLTYDGTTAKLYVDGVLKTSTTVNYNLTGVTDYIRVGTGTGLHWGSFVGSIDEVAIYDRVLNPNEISYHYNSSSPVEIVPGMQPAFLVSSIYDSNSADNILGSMIANGSLPNASTTVSYQIRSGSSADPVAIPGNWKNWCGNASCNGVDAFGPNLATGQPLSISNSQLTSSSAGNRYFQYRVLLNTDGQYTPTAGTTTIQYVVNEPPTVNITNTVSQLATTTGKVQLDYQVSDSDASSGTNFPNTLQLSLYACTANCTSAGNETWSGTPASAGSLANYDSSWNATGTTVYVSSASSTYHLIWTPDYLTTNSNFRVKMVVNDREGANNTNYTTSNVFDLDSQKPSMGATPIKVDNSVVPPLVTLSASDAHSLKLKLWTDSAFDYISDSTNNSATWVSYNSTSTLDLSGEPTVVYAAFRDSYGNLSTSTAVLPEKPSITMIQDTSNIKDNLNEYRLFLAWKKPTSTASFASYNVYRASTPTSTYSLIGSISSTTINYYTDATMEPLTDTYYKVAIQDISGNVSYLSAQMWGNADATQNAGEGGGGAGAGISAAPVISNISTTSVFTTQATVRWDTDKLSDSVVEYTTNGDGTFADAVSTGLSTMLDNAGSLGRHQIVLSGLSPSTVYYLRIRSTNGYGATASSTLDGLGRVITITTLGGPVITDVATSTISNTTAVINWNTDIAASSYVIYSTSTNPDLGIARQAGDSQEVTGHSVTIAGLIPNTTYYFYVKSDINRNDNSGNYYNFKTTLDNSAPVINSVASSVTDTTATINWSTNEAASSTVVYGLAANNYSWSQDNNNLNIDHFITLTGLASSTTYYYKIVAFDQNNNIATSTEYTFETDATPDTTAPKLSGSPIVTTFVDGANISWTTDESAYSYIQYAATTTDFSSIYQEIGGGVIGLSHSATTTALSQGGRYYYRIRSVDGVNNASTTGFYQFDTVSGPPINNPMSTSTDTSAAISWDTDPVLTDGFVYLSTSSDFSTYKLIGSTDKSTSTHSISLSGLTASTTYYFKIRSMAANNGLTTSGMLSFTTAHEPAPTLLTNLVRSITNNSALFTWTLDRPGITTIYYDNTSSSTFANSVSTDNYSIDNYFGLTGLINSATYYFKMIFSNPEGIQTQTTGQFDTLATPDITAPVFIEAPSVTDSSADSATISWKLNEPASFYVQYATSSANLDNGAYTEVGNNTILADNVVHSVVLSGLSQGLTYYYRARSVDASNNTATSSKSSFVTQAGPSITSVSTSTVAETSATITWLTGSSSDSYVIYDTNSNFSASVTVGNPINTTTHSVGLTGLVAGTKYYFRIRSTDAVTKGVTTYPSSPAYFEFTTDIDSLAPDITITATSTTANSATISWRTNELATSYINYATSSQNLDSGLYQTANEYVADYNSNHSYTIGSLSENTTYYFRLFSADHLPNSTSTTISLRTTSSKELKIIKPMLLNTTANTAQIRWSTKNENNTAQLATSSVQYATTKQAIIDGNYTETSNNTPALVQTITLSGLSSNATYYYRLVSSDSRGETKIDDNGGLFYSLTATLGPKLINISSEGVTETGATITWSSVAQDGVTPLAGDSTLIFDLNANFQNIDFVYDAASTSDHSITLTGLSPQSTYHYQVRTVAANGVTTQTGGQFLTSQDVTPPVISNTNASLVTDTSALIRWHTDEAANSVVGYGTTTKNNINDFTYHSEDLTSYNFDHSISLTSLSASTTYYFMVKSTDDSTFQNSATSSVYSFTTSNAGLVSSETIAALQDQIDTLQNSLNAMTAERDGLLEDKADLLNQVTALQTQITTLTQEKAVSETTISSLSAQLAVLNKQVEDLKNNSGGGGVIFIDKADKTAPVITDISASEIKADSAKISWNTNEEASSFIKYGVNRAYGSNFGYSKLTRNHEFYLENLLPGTVYNFQIESGDSSGNLSSSENSTFTTPSIVEQLTAEGKSLEEIKKAEELGKNNEQLLIEAAKKAMEIVSNVANTVSLGTLEATLFSQYDAIEKLATSIPAPIMGGEPGVVTTATTATIGWRTDKDSSSLVAYSPENIFKISENKGDDAYVQVVGDSDTKTKSHSVKIVDLKPETTYHYQLRSKADIGPMGKSIDFVFTTKAQTLEISNYTVQNVSTEKAIFRWITSSETDSKLVFVPYRGNKLAVEESKTLSEKGMTTIHEITVDGLEGGTIYQVELSGKNAKGNVTSRVIETYSTSADDLPPQIFQVQTESALSTGKDTRVQTIISWMTNEPTLGQVNYIKGVNQNADDFNEKTPLETGYGKKHVMVITKFTPGTVYSFRVSAIDSAGNQTLSKIYTILTPRQKESVFQLILKNFESTFGWMGKLGGQ